MPPFLGWPEVYARKITDLRLEVSEETFRARLAKCKIKKVFTSWEASEYASERRHWEWRPAPEFDEEMNYVHTQHRCPETHKKQFTGLFIPCFEVPSPMYLHCLFCIVFVYCSSIFCIVFVYIV